METINDKLCYYSKSRDVPAGKGVNEFSIDASKYEELNRISKWRSILSNFYLEPFIYEGKTYNTVEHVFQSYKIKIANEEKAFYFTLESGHEIGRGDGSVAQKNRKLVKLNKDQLKIWDEMKEELMIDITRERIFQSKIYKTVLMLTLDAELWHCVSRKPAIRNEYLEKLRNEI